MFLENVVPSAVMVGSCKHFFPRFSWQHCRPALGHPRQGLTLAYSNEGNLGSTSSRLSPNSHADLYCDSNELRLRECKEKDSRDNSPELETRPGTSQAPQDVSWQKNATDPRHAPEPRSLFTSDQYQPLHRPYLQLIPKCVDLYYEHIYPIMPLLYMPAIRAMIARQMTAPEKNLIYALCGLVGMHMSGKSLHVDGPASWEEAGRFFLDECVSNRQSYDFMEDSSLSAVISSFWLSTSFFEINQNRKSWLYLREALTLAQDMGLHDDATYVGLSPEEALCRQRVFWQLFVTER